jgi:hypothetical protein
MSGILLPGVMAVTWPKGEKRYIVGDCPAGRAGLPMFIILKSQVKS